MASKKKSSNDAPTTPAKFPARARKKAAAGETAVAAEAPAAVPTDAVVVAAPVETAPVVVAPAPEVAATVAVEAVEPTHDAIRARAYAIWRAEGGSAQANWLRAEAELRGR